MLVKVEFIATHAGADHEHGWEMTMMNDAAISNWCEYKHSPDSSRNATIAHDWELTPS